MHIPDATVLPASITRLMSEADRKSIGAGAELPSESMAKYQLGRERQMHKEFGAWLDLNGILYVRSRMDRASTCGNGVPDFICVKGNRCCFVEMKAPGGRLSEVQKSYIRRLEADAIPVLVAYSVKDAIDFCRERIL